MQMNGVFTVEDVYRSERGSTYVTLHDEYHGGSLKVTFVDGRFEVPERGTTHIVKAELQSGIARGGGIFLRVLDWASNPVSKTFK